MGAKGLNKELTEYKISELQQGIVALHVKVESLDQKNDRGFKSIGGKLDSINAFIAGYGKDKESRDKEQILQDSRIDRLERGGLGVLVATAFLFLGLVWNGLKALLGWR